MIKMNTLETQEVTGGLIEVPEYNIFDESQNSEEYCEEMRLKINLPYDELKDIYREQIESLPEDTKNDVESLLDEKCTDCAGKHAISPVGFVPIFGVFIISLCHASIGSPNRSCLTK